MARLFVPHLLKRGILTFHWIVNEEEEWEQAVREGCRGIMTDKPSELSKYLFKKGLYLSEGISDNNEVHGGRKKDPSEAKIS